MLRLGDQQRRPAALMYRLYENIELINLHSDHENDINDIMPYYVRLRLPEPEIS